ncbi:diguanylate cyclase [bacterium]|nr:diguanylate cyclase [bacterium]
MLKKIFYFTLSIIFALFIYYSVFHFGINGFVESVENKTFDLRQSIISKNKTASKDIVLITIDDASYEYILDNIGEWPLPRGLYADVINYVEKQNPKMIIFDMLFIKSAKSSQEDNIKLGNAFRKFDNVYTAMNFDYQAFDLRVPQDLDEKFELNVNNLSKDVDFEENTFTNYRPIIDEIMKNTANVGSVNIARSPDGVLRQAPVFVKYNDKFYPQIAFLAGYKAITTEPETSFVIDKNGYLLYSGKKIPLDKNGNTTLNWYGSRGNYLEIPIYKIMKNIKGQNIDLGVDFKDKTVLVGMTANSLFDLKTTPTDKLYPGVEILATYINNVYDNNFISKAPTPVTVAICFIISLIIGIITLRLNHVGSMIGLTLLTYFGYTIFTVELMKYCNMWLELVPPLIFATFVFIAMLIVKYVIKTRDFEQQYKLATTDGLTGLYNHRYFQEQLANVLENSKRYETPFSLIIIDIDDFKKFNDTFGHQAGDRVLLQVAQLLKRNVRSADIVCRYGGEEMSIILPNINKESAIFTAEKLCKTISSKEFMLNDKPAKVTISLGVSTYPQDGLTTQEIIKIADDRLYKAKGNGKNQVWIE